MPTTKKTTAPKQTKAKKSTGSAKKSSSKQAAAAATTETPTVVAPPEPPAPVSTESTTVSTTTTQSATSTEDSWNSIESRFSALNTRMVEWKTLYNQMQTELRSLHRDVTRHMKEVSKRNRRRRRAQDGDDKTPRAPSGFAKPTLMSNELCAFLGEAPGTEMARTEVTKYLTNYIKTNNLQNQANKRIIQPDAKLTALLNVQPSDEVTYFNLQKYMKVHFPKQSASATTSA